MAARRTGWKRGALALALATVVLAVGAAAEDARPEEPESPGARAQRLVAEERWDEAATAFRALADVHPDDAALWSGLGLALRESGRTEEALAAYERALAQDSTSVPALAGIAVTLDRLGRRDEAFARLGEAVRRGLPAAVLRDNAPFAPLRTDPRFAALEAEAERLAHPCRHDPRWSEFDFWVGTWDVQVGGVTRARNVISREMDGCLVRERYANPTGYTGESLNFIDPDSGTWKQVWVDARGGVVRYEGGLEREGVMRMEGTNTTLDGRTQPARVTWTRLDGGRVHHVIEQSPDGGKTWSTYFDAVYVPAAEEAGSSE